ncbi:3'(2'),5'-bisphosphate nucleotidase [Novosphingobium kunmingense]|uniref:3'(2'),5'-bisphosphate nucleotidase n=1 Tax=Novosphingobium kunmingense TaxID=1211806 RepID=A0A2N0HKH1_9SPHN|nr:3'(2'),5'-bisphosphate nucleotidase CysQ [Novosphingobium kunmingense]PKB19399.1 3'(2'),5'-bisphosphate nucleotidase [Novosphingobium kunmingense]
MTDAELAAAVAEQAGRLLLDLREHGTPDGEELGAAGDRIANRFVRDALRRARPNDAFLSEEDPDSLCRLDNARCWIIDPLDGTREYAEGRDDWAVHVALTLDRTPAIGAVSLPAQDLVLRSDRPRRIDGMRSPPRIVVSRTRPPRAAAAVAQALGAEVAAMGSAGAKAMAVVRGQADIYLHSGGQHEWDNCAPVAVALAAGLHATRLDGTRLLYNGKDTAVPDLLICRNEWAKPVMACLAALDCGRSARVA